MRIVKIMGATLRGFYFNGISFSVTSFQCIYVPYRGEAVAIYNEGRAFNPRLLNYTQHCRAGDRFIFTEIKAKGPEGQPRYLNSIPLEVI
jgi:hypothetical protein